MSQLLTELIAANPGMSLAEIADNLREVAGEIEGKLIRSERAKASWAQRRTKAQSPPRSEAMLINERQ